MKTEAFQSFHDLSQAATVVHGLKGKPIVVDQPTPGDIVDHPDKVELKGYNFDQLGPHTFEIMVRLSAQIQIAYQGDLYHDVGHLHDRLREMVRVPVSSTFYWLVRKSGTTFWMPKDHPAVLETWTRMMSCKAYRVSWLSEREGLWTIKFTVIHDSVTVKDLPGAKRPEPGDLTGIPDVTDQA